MSRPRTWRLGAVALGAAGVVLQLGAMGAAQGAATLPRVPTSLESTERALTLRPAEITVSQDGNESLWGAGARGFSGQRHAPREPRIQWRRWTGREALASASMIAGDCVPSCARGRFRSYPLALTLSRPAMVGGQRLFTRLSYRFTGARPANTPRTVTWVAVHLHGGGGAPQLWGWKPAR